MSRTKHWTSVEKAARSVAQHIAQGCQEKHYHSALAAALASAGVPFASQIPIQVKTPMGAPCGQRIPDLIVGSGREALVVEIKARRWFSPDNRAQLQGYLQLLNIPQGMLLGFCTLKQGEYNVEQVTPNSPLEYQYGDTGDPATEAQTGTITQAMRRRFPSRMDAIPRAITKKQASQLISMLKRGTDHEVWDLLEVLAQGQRPQQSNRDDRNQRGAPSAPVQSGPASTPFSVPSYPEDDREKESHPGPAHGAPHHSPMPYIARQAPRPIWNQNAPGSPPNVVPFSQRAQSEREERSHQKQDRTGQSAAGAVSRASQAPPPLPPQEAVEAPEPPAITSTRERADVPISRSLYGWLMQEWDRTGARSLPALIVPWLEHYCQHTPPSEDTQTIATFGSRPERGKSQRVQIVRRNPQLWTMIARRLGSDENDDVFAFIRSVLGLQQQVRQHQQGATQTQPEER